MPSARTDIDGIMEGEVFVQVESRERMIDKFVLI
jgi:hypothetical protein